MSSYLVTGASRGLGLATVVHLASLSDVKVVFATSRSLTPALKAVIESSSEKVVYVKMEITDEASVKSAAEVVKKRLGDSGLDVLLNNAGITAYTPGWIETL